MVVSEAVTSIHDITILKKYLLGSLPGEIMQLFIFCYYPFLYKNKIITNLKK